MTRGYITLERHFVKQLIENGRIKILKLMRTKPGSHQNDNGHEYSIFERCPHGDIGDEIWVKEEYCIYDCHNTAQWGRQTVYAADYQEPTLQAAKLKIIKDLEHQTGTNGWYSRDCYYKIASSMKKNQSRMKLYVEDINFFQLHNKKWYWGLSLRLL
jgi:hypothetical protein